MSAATSHLPAAGIPLVLRSPQHGSTIRLVRAVRSGWRTHHASQSEEDHVVAERTREPRRNLVRNLATARQIWRRFTGGHGLLLPGRPNPRRCRTVSGCFEET